MATTPPFWEDRDSRGGVCAALLMDEAVDLRFPTLTLSMLPLGLWRRCGLLLWVLLGGASLGCGEPLLW